MRLVCCPHNFDTPATAMPALRLYSGQASAGIHPPSFCPLDSRIRGNDAVPVYFTLTEDYEEASADCQKTPRFLFAKAIPSTARGPFAT